MNAQEAIKLTEQALTDTKEEVKEYLNDPFVPEKDKNIMRNDLKAQEIVLESAKTLNDLIKSADMEGLAVKSHVSGTGIFLPEETWKKIGKWKGADE